MGAGMLPVDNQRGLLQGLSTLSMAEATHRAHCSQQE